MCPTQLIEDLDSGRARWRDVPEDKKRAAVGYVFQAIRKKGDGAALTRDRWSRIAPPWCPRNVRYLTGLFDDVDTWPELVTLHGLRAGQQRKRIAGTAPATARKRCDCGQPATRHVPIQILNPHQDQRNTWIDLCEDCYAEFIEIEESRP